MSKTILSERIRHARKSRGLTQAQLAEQLGMSEMTVRRWENGLRSPRIDEIRKIAETLNISSEELLNEDMPEIPAANTNAIHALAQKIADENSELDALVSAGITTDNIIIKDNNTNRTYYLPNNEEGRKLFLMVLNGGLKGMGITVTSPQIPLHNINGSHSNYHDSVVHNGDVIADTPVTTTA